MKIGICTDHGGYALKQIIHELLIKMGYGIVDFGAFEYDDDYTDFVIPLARSIAAKDVHRGIAILWKWCWCIYSPRTKLLVCGRL